MNNGIQLDETSTAVINGVAYGRGKKLTKADRKAIRDQEKQFQGHKKLIGLCNEYAELQKRKRWVNPLNKRELFALQWHIMSILLKYTLIRGLYSTNVAKMEIEAFTRGMAE